MKKADKRINYSLVKETIYLDTNKNEYNTEYDSTELTPDDFGLILDALYEQAAQQKKLCKGQGKSYYLSLYKVAKKFERIFNEEK